MGVSGSGKSVVAAELARSLGWTFAEGDAFHSAANRAKMAAGQPLTDEDRVPWLRRLAAWMGERDEAGESTVMSCSSLKRSYRDLLRQGAPDPHFVHLVGSKDLLLQRMRDREHFMPPALLESQLETLQPLGADERGVTVDVSGTKAETLRAVRRRLALDE